MKYILAAGWKPYDEWNDFVIDIYDDWYTALGRAYDYLQNFIEDEWGRDIFKGPLYRVITNEDGKKSIVKAEYNKSKKPVYFEDLIRISPIYDIHDEAGYWLEIQEIKHDKHNWDGDLSGIIGNYVRIFTFNDDKKEVTDEELG